MLSAAVIVFFAMLCVVLLGMNMRKELSHDEQMYVAGGVLPARAGLLPYRDYAYFQMPNLALVYALLFKVSSYPLLAARAFSTICATLLLAVLFRIAFGLFSGFQYPARFLLAAGGVLLLATNPLFTYTSGLAWNHDLSVLLLALACFCCYCFAKQPSIARLSLAGVLLGLAVGTRLSLAPAVAPFVGAIFLLPEGSALRDKVRGSLALVVGACLSLLPSAVLFALAPAQFLFDNIRYHEINTAYWRQNGYERAMTTLDKLAYMKEVLTEPGNMALLLPLLFTLAVMLFAAITRHSKPITYCYPIVFLSMVAAFLMLGALGPTPTWYQYFYAPLPFVLLGVVYAVASLSRHEKWGRLAPALVALPAIISFALWLPNMDRLSNLLIMSEWTPVKAHNLGLEISRVAGAGKVLTLAPIFPIEGGVDTYEEFAAGPFGWRSTSLIPSQERVGLRVASAQDLDALLKREPPKTMLTGFEAGLEEPFINYARLHNYTAVQLTGGATLWVSPQEGR